MRGKYHKLIRRGRARTCSLLCLVACFFAATQVFADDVVEDISGEFKIIGPDLTLPAPQLYLAGIANAGFGGVAAPDDEFAEFPGDEAEKIGGLKSPFVAAGLSLALPGAGQLYARNPGQARLFLGLEAATWLSYAGLRMFAEWREDDVLRFAQRHAGITPGDRDEEYLRLLTFYDSRERYNTIGRAFDPEDPYFPDDPALDWKWDSPENQQEFRRLFNDKRSADRNAEFMFVIAGTNRLISAALAWREAKRYNGKRRHDALFGARPPTPRTIITLRSPDRNHAGAGGLTVNITRMF